MANKIVFDDGKEITLSTETTERLRKELLKPTPPKDFVYGDFSMKIKNKHLVISTDYQKERVVHRYLTELKKIRNQLNIYIDYLEEN